MKKFLCVLILLPVLLISIVKVDVAKAAVDWTNVTWNVMGDSLTDPNNTLATKKYYDYIQEDLHIKKVNNYGISGSTVSNNSNPMSERYINMDNGADLITVFTGFNDFSRNVPLGNSYDTTNNTYYGALDVLLKGLVQKFPNKKIGLISMYAFSQYPVNNQFGIPDYAYVNAEIDVCNRYKVKHLNLYEMDSMNLATDGSKYRAFQNHLNNQGHEHLATIIESFIKGM